MIDSRTSTEKFFRSYRSESGRIKRNLSETYYLLRLYQKLHEASGGGPSILDDPFGEGDGFSGGGGFDGGGFDGGSGFEGGSMPESMFD